MSMPVGLVSDHLEIVLGTHTAASEKPCELELGLEGRSAISERVVESG
jgi:hypothetical protein